ncbi:MAG: GNAT family N-acetyltransferase [Acidobacteriia bacterium]|nr:GNAT family N-acetyltransferase [Terriglobia bacterium]
MSLLVREPVNAVVYPVQPLQDPRWARLVERCPRSSVFHTVAWLEALHRTYGYIPVVYTTSPPEDELRNGIVFCRVSSWVTGRRLVSLPFSDHCEALVDSAEELDSLLSALQSAIAGQRFRYIELRPLELAPGSSASFHRSENFCFHRISLERGLPELFHSFHKSCTQQRIKHAEREGLEYEAGASPSLLRRFYGLFLLTRRRHNVPPPPLKWFFNLAACLADQLRIHMASKGGQPIASILTLRAKARLVCKYACSDPAFNSLGGIHLLHWRTLQEAVGQGLKEYDMGRSEWSNTGLVNFKEHWGAVRSDLTYWRCGPGSNPIADCGLSAGFRAQVIAHMPDAIFRAAGGVLYRHFG